MAVAVTASIFFATACGFTDEQSTSAQPVSDLALGAGQERLQVVDVVVVPGPGRGCR